VGLVVGDCLAESCMMHKGTEIRKVTMNQQTMNSSKLNLTKSFQFYDILNLHINNIMCVR